MAIGSDKRFEMGRVFERAVGVLQANAGVFIILALLLGALPTAVLEIVQWKVMGMEPGQQAMPTAGTWGVWAVTLLVTTAFAYTLQGAVTRGAIVSLNGGKASLGDCISTGIQVLLPAFAISLLAGLGELVGFMLLIVPGIILTLAWIVAIPVRVMEGRGVGAALSRSAELTRGHRGALFLMFLVLGVAYFFFSMAMGLVFVAVAAAVSPGSVGIAALISQPLIGGVASMVSAALVASVYYELRTIKDGVGADRLAAVFD